MMELGTKTFVRTTRFLALVVRGETLDPTRFPGLEDTGGEEEEEPEEEAEALV